MESRAETAAFVSERPGCVHSVCVSAPHWTEERGESTAAIVSADSEYWDSVKIFRIKVFEKNPFV